MADPVEVGVIAAVGVAVGAILTHYLGPRFKHQLQRARDKDQRQAPVIEKLSVLVEELWNAANGSVTYHQVLTSPEVRLKRLAEYSKAMFALSEFQLKNRPYCEKLFEDVDALINKVLPPISQLQAVLDDTEMDPKAAAATNAQWDKSRQGLIDAEPTMERLRKHIRKALAVT